MTARRPIRITNRRAGGVLRWAARLIWLVAVAVTFSGAAVSFGAYVHFSRDLPRILSVED
ncbi:MAG: hypothetical protein KC620_20520 [Myxococcales bacterium]|nr:hypothetical protein [Myxococcales bacterium]